MGATIRHLVRLISSAGALAYFLLRPMAAVGQTTPPTNRPNIVLIVADDLGYGDVGFNGRTTWRTPNLDRLAREGTAFHRWYTASVVCAPSRAALMTGRYGIHNGVSGNNDELPRSEVTIAQALKDAGYATALFGKWHHGATRPGETSYIHPMDRGFDEFFGFTDARHAWEHFPKELWDGREMKPVKGQSDTLFTDHGIDYIKRHKSGPFFLYLAYNTPHFNIEAPQAEIAPFLGKFKEKDPAKPYNAIYAAMVAHMDREIGRFLDALDGQGLAKNTIVVFTSDNGATFEGGNNGASAYHDSNRPFRGQKRNLWEGGMRMPAAVRWPGHVPAGVVSQQTVHMIDVFPTLLAAAGAAPPSPLRLDGMNLLDAWTGATKTPVERTLFWEWRVEGYYQVAAMRGDYKLVLTGGNPPELFNVVTDEAERRNVIAEYPELSRALRERLTAWLATESAASKWGKTNRDGPGRPLGRGGGAQPAED